MKRAAMRTSFNSWENCRRYESDQFDFLDRIDNPKKLLYSRTIPIKTLSEANVSEHWSKSSKRHKMQKDIVHCFLKIDRPVIQPPCTIKITRIAPRMLDSHDNLRMSMKWIIDALLEYINPNKAVGRADDDLRVSYEYDQEKGLPKEYAIRIEIKGLP